MSRRKAGTENKNRKNNRNVNNRRTGKRSGDRWDGTRIRDIDPMHFVMPMIYPGRCDNEAFISEVIDLTETNRYLEKKNKDAEYHYNLFQTVVAAAMKTLTLRPKMNRFIANKTMYQRNRLTAAFVVKKQFKDNGGEGLAVLRVRPDDNINTIHGKIYRQITENRSGEEDESSHSMDVFSHIPVGIAKGAAAFFRFLDRRGRVPHSLIATDPYYCSVVLTNLGSIGLNSGYHHLVNWGTNSVFIAIGQIKKRPFYKEDGTVEMRDSVEIGLTIDERLADGYYYSKTVALLKKLIENPELLEKRLDEKVE